MGILHRSARDGADKAQHKTGGTGRIRVSLLAVGLMVATAGLAVWTSGAPDEPQRGEVTRAEPAALSLTPALSQPAPEPVAATAPMPAAPSAPTVQPDDGMTAMREMSYSILDAFGNPEADPDRTAAPEVADAGRTYTVQPGDSLPGIAFRFYGTTAAYSRILNANADQLSDPSRFAAGMTLRLPDP